MSRTHPPPPALRAHGNYRQLSRRPKRARALVYSTVAALNGRQGRKRAALKGIDSRSPPGRVAANKEGMMVRARSLCRAAGPVKIGLERTGPFPRASTPGRGIGRDPLIRFRAGDLVTHIKYRIRRLGLREPGRPRVGAHAACDPRRRRTRLPCFLPPPVPQRNKQTNGFVKSQTSLLSVPGSRSSAQTSFGHFS